MRATLDSYLQMRVELTPEDVKLLEERRQVDGEVWRPRTGEKTPLRVYYTPNESKLLKKFRKDSKRYQIYIGPGQLILIKRGEITGEGIARDLLPPGNWLRSVEISLEDALE